MESEYSLLQEVLNLFSNTKYNNQYVSKDLKI